MYKMLHSVTYDNQINQQQPAYTQKGKTPVQRSSHKIVQSMDANYWDDDIQLLRKTDLEKNIIIALASG